MLYRFLLLWLMSLDVYALEFLPKEIIAHIFYYQGQEDEQNINLFFIDKYMNNMLNDESFIDIILHKFDNIQLCDIDNKIYVLLCSHIIKLFYNNNREKLKYFTVHIISFELENNNLIDMEKLLSFISIEEIAPFVGNNLSSARLLGDICEHGLINILKLLEYKLKPQNIEWQYLFSSACSSGHLVLVKYLITKPININHRFFDHTTGLYQACKNGHNDIVKLLLEKGALLIDNDPYLPIHVSAYYIAASEGHRSCLELLEAKFGNNLANHQAINGSTPLYYACKNNHVDCVQHLIRNNADVNYKFLCNYSPLYVASQNGFLALVDILLSNNANINDATAKGSTSLLVAVKYGHLDIVKLLLSHQAEVNYVSRSSFMSSPLEEAINNNDITIIKLLLSYGANESLLSHIASMKLIKLYLDNNNKS